MSEPPAPELAPPPDSAPSPLHPYHWLAAVPAVVLLAGIPFVNRARATIFGFPPLLAWIVIWVVAISGTMALLLHLDHARDPARR